MSHCFPPFNLIGAVRVGKLARFLEAAGHEVRVLAGENPVDRSLPVEISPDHITYVQARRVDEILDPVVRFVRRGTKSTVAGPTPMLPAPFATASIADRLRAHYYALLQMPDKTAGWIKPAVAAGRRIASGWRPDIIFASGPPHSALIVGRRIAQTYGTPWIAELRDLWTDNAYYDHPAWRRLLDRQIERTVLHDAAALVTVSPIWSETLRRHYQQPVACILNGYAEEDLSFDQSGPPTGDSVSIVYTGNIYAGYRDPSALFRAVDLLGNERQRVAIHFYGSAERDIYGLAAAQTVRDRVFVHDRVPYRSSLALQLSADVLLLLQCADVRDAGNLPAKFFEYLGARRPILMLGYEHGNLAAMIRERGVGLVSNDPTVIAAQLRRWIAQRPAGIGPVDPAARQGMTRDEQFVRLERFLLETFYNETKR